MKCEACQNDFFKNWDLTTFIFNQIKYDSVICLECQEQFIKIGPNYCFGCGKYQTMSDMCIDCMSWMRKGQTLLQNRALYRYSQMMKWFFREYKFKGGYHLRTIFLGELETLIEAERMIVIIPIAANKLKQRGFNQTKGLLQDQTHGSNLLRCKQSFQTTQSQKSREQRIHTPQWFELNVDRSEVKGQMITLIDDIYTTGRTLYHAADCLYVAGAKNVNSITLVR